MKRVYLAGPDVFLANAIEMGRLKCAVCARHGLQGMFPLDQVLDLEGLSPRDRGLAIFAANRALMDHCDVCIAHCTPFRGPSMDVGTAIEIGYMFSQGKPVWGYTNVTGVYADRVADAEGMDVEQFGLADNLMIEGAMENSGGRMVQMDAPAAQRYTWLTAFEACVHEAARCMQ